MFYFVVVFSLLLISDLCDAHTGSLLVCLYISVFVWWTHIQVSVARTLFPHIFICSWAFAKYTHFTILFRLLIPNLSCYRYYPSRYHEYMSSFILNWNPPGQFGKTLTWAPTLLGQVIVGIHWAASLSKSLEFFMYSSKANYTFLFIFHHIHIEY